MDYTNFGSAGVKVSRIALGLGLRGQGNETEAQKLVEHAIASGINFIDCANIYGPNDDRANIGRSEVVAGKAIADKRDQIILTSKVCGQLGPDPNDRGTSAFHIHREIENSLRRLNTDYLDVYLVHNYDETTPLEETMRALDDIVRSGKARYVGCCNYMAWQVCRALWVSDSTNSASFMCVQNPYNLLNRGLENEMFGLIRDRGLGAMAYSPAFFVDSVERIYQRITECIGVNIERRMHQMRNIAIHRAVILIQGNSIAIAVAQGFQPVSCEFLFGQRAIGFVMAVDFLFEVIERHLTIYRVDHIVYFFK